MAVLQPHDRVGGYTIIRHVRSGSTGDLYIARRVGAPGFAPNVALKVIAPPLHRMKSASDLLDQEIIRAAKIDDPRVVRLEELGDDHGVRYVAMELVRGFSLADMLAFYYERERRIPPGLAVYIALQAALGLQAAHETRDAQGNHLRLVHGTLTTKRLLVSWKGHVKLIRFGFSKVMAAEPMTSWQRLFRAPDVPDGHNADGRADVFALGALLLASLARGGLPVLDGGIDVSAVHDALARATGIPTAVGDVLVHSLQTRREDRSTPLVFYRALVEAMPQALLTTPSDVTRELAAIRLDREFATFAQDRSLIGSSYIPPRMTEVPSPFTTTQPKSSAESAASSERLVVPPMPAPPLLASMGVRGAPTVVESTPPPPPSSASLLTTNRVEYPAAAAATAAELTTVESAPAIEARRASERPSANAPAEVERAAPAEEPPPEAVAEPSPEPSPASVAVEPDAPDAPPPPRSNLPVSMVAIAIAFAAGLLVAAGVGALRGDAKPTLDLADAAGGPRGAALDFSPPLAPVPLTTSLVTTGGDVRPADAAPASPPDAAPADAATLAITDASATPAAPAEDMAEVELRAIANAAAATGSDEAFERAGTRVLAGDIAGARAVLESRLAAGPSNADEVQLLHAICKQQRDGACLDRLRRLEATAPSPAVKH